jgi:flavin reductase (DIM6/NTAB) family NADH-FMN oxidoreductase RutF
VVALPIEGTPYALLRNLTLPVVAVTTRAGGRTNAMIANSAQRASLVPSVSRISIYISKTNYTHDLVRASGVLGVHLLRRDQWDLIWHLGFQSGRDADKLARLPLTTAVTGCPLLPDTRAAFDCRVVNAMDAGASTFFLADVVAHLEGEAAEVMTSEYFRMHMPEDKRRVYEQRLMEAMDVLEPMARTVRREAWAGPSGSPS